MGMAIKAVWRPSKKDYKLGKKLLISYLINFAVSKSDQCFEYGISYSFAIFWLQVFLLISMPGDSLWLCQDS